MAKSRSPYVYFTRLSLTNVKSFGATQELNLTDTNGRPVQWTLILGDNGVGKTTLLQCLALMRPVLSTEKGTDVDSPKPDRVEPGLMRRENADIVALARMGAKMVALEADLVGGTRLNGTRGRPMPLRVSVSIDMKANERDFTTFKPSEEVIPGFTPPLVIGYSAARHMSYRRGDVTSTSDDATDSLFDASVELADADEILQRLDYAGFKGSSKARALLNRLKEALAKLLPDIEKGSDIVLYEPATPGSDEIKTGVQVKTPYGEVPIAALSLGYQTVTAWAIDLAWKLFERYPDAKDPLQQPAIVLMDEIDLHLHPLWQRSIRASITEFFPHVQFIVTAHSPLMAQSYLDANLVVLKRCGDHVEIEDDPAVVAEWRLDEIITSDLFGLGSAYPPPIDNILRERARLLKLERRDPKQKARLAELERVVASLPSENDASDQAVLERLRSAAAALSE